MPKSEFPDAVINCRSFVASNGIPIASFQWMGGRRVGLAKYYLSHLPPCSTYDPLSGIVRLGPYTLRIVEYQAERELYVLESADGISREID